jgi:hypothetical protein
VEKKKEKKEKVPSLPSAGEAENPSASRARHPRPVIFERGGTEIVRNAIAEDRSTRARARYEFMGRG